MHIMDIPAQRGENCQWSAIRRSGMSLTPPGLPACIKPSWLYPTAESQQPPTSTTSTSIHHAEGYLFVLLVAAGGALSHGFRLGGDPTITMTSSTRRRKARRPGSRCPAPIVGYPLGVCCRTVECCRRAPICAGRGG
jgi:hypothetical protein